ncbi:MAG TPA: YfhO family protein [Thermoanaerobaculia bacterium]|nr:YfhO family protein [Thermoanaerobaculia bacterium]
MLLVLRLLAVYFGTAAVGVWWAHRFVLRISGRVALFLALAPLLLTGRALLSARLYAPVDILYQAPPYASQAAEMGIGPTLTPALGDVAYQSIAWKKATREAIRHGRLPLWNRFLLTGEPLLAVQQAALLHPATWIGCLLPLPQAWTYEMALRLFLAVLCGYLFLADLGVGTVAALLGACGWAFCDWLVFYAGYSIAPAAAPYPLLLLGLRRLARALPGREARRAVVLTIVALLLILVSGHPESLLYAVAGGAIYFLFELAWAGRQGGRRGWMVPLNRSLLAGALTLGIAAVQLVPFAEALPHTVEHYFRSAVFAHMKRSLPPGVSLSRTATSLVPYAYGVSGLGLGSAEIVEPSAYLGTVLLPFALLGFASRRREKWPLVVSGALGLALFTRLVGVTDALDALPLFDIGVNDRMIFLTAFALAGLAALGAERLAEAGGVRLFALAGAGTTLALVGTFLLLRPAMAEAELPSSYIGTHFALQLVPLLLAVAAVLGIALRGRHRIPLALGACLVLLLAQRGLEAGSVYPTLPGDALHPRLPIFDHIPPGEPWRFVAVGYSMIPNTPGLYELEDVRGYEAMTFHPLFDTFPLWCEHQPVWFNRVDDPNRPFLSFLNVRWALLANGSEAAVPDWTLLHHDEAGLLYENPRALPRAFVPRQIYREPDPQREIAVLGTIADFGEQGVANVAPGAAPPRTWAANGRASVRIAAYAGQEMALDVDAAEAALVATSIVAWPGWQLRLDGRPAPTASYNHAFVGFLVPPGRHRAVLTYLPGSVVWGAAVSLASLLVSAWLFWRSSTIHP